MNVWELIFSQSPVNDGYYEEDSLPQQNWDWPKGTWFQSRLDFVRERQPVLGLTAGRKTRDSIELRTM